MPNVISGIEVSLIIASPTRWNRERVAEILRDRHPAAQVTIVDLERDGMAIITTERPDVVFVDLSQTYPIGTCSDIKNASPSTRLVAFGLNETIDNVIECLRAGCHGYIRSEDSSDELSRAVVDAMADRIVLSIPTVKGIVDRLDLVPKSDAPSSLPCLSPRENEVLAIAALGHSNKEIARQLSISNATVKNHMHNILRKLRVQKRGQAIAILRARRHAQA